MLYRGSIAAGALALAGSASSARLFSASYDGHVTTFDFSGSSLTQVAQSTACGPFPSWLTIEDRTMYCVNEGWGTPSELHSFSIGDGGLLSRLDNLTIAAGPVSSVVYGENRRGLAVANYEAGGFSTFNIANPSEIVPVQEQVWTLDKPGPVTDRQSKPFPHQAILDPEGKFLVVPDLGADAIRILAIDSKTLKYTEKKSVKLPPGTGPRHGAFAQVNGKTFFYVVGELTNTLHGFEVTSCKGGELKFKEIYKSLTGGQGAQTPPEGTSAAEVQISPDNKFVIVSSRNEKNILIDNFDATNSTKLPSDPLYSFKIDQRNGKLTHVDTASAGGVNPRHFSLNKDGSIVASALQSDGRIVLIARDVATGKLGDFIAHTDATYGMANSIIWDEE